MVPSLSFSFVLRLLACATIAFSVAATARAADPAPKQTETAVATFAGGCFWCMEPPFEKLEGVQSVVSGYTGGTVANPKYEQVSAGGTGHVESVQITFDPNKVTFEKLLEVFWRNIDPTDSGGQFVDRGAQYRPVIFVHDEAQKKLAEDSKTRLGKSKRFDKPVTTEILPAKTFYAAEEYHQDYYKKNPIRYKFYRLNSGRDQFLERYWKNEAKSPIQK